MNKTAVVIFKSKGLVIEYLEESDFLSVLKDTVNNPDTLNLPAKSKWCVIRYTHTPLEAVGYFITAASLALPKIISALKNDRQREGVAEFFETQLSEQNKKLIDLLKQREASKGVEVSEKDFPTSTTTTCNR